MTVVKAFAAMEAGGDFEPFEYELDPIGSEHVDIEVESCGICHSVLSMRDNDWQMTQYPFVGGHEVIGKVVSAGMSISRQEKQERWIRLQANLT